VTHREALLPRLRLSANIERLRSFDPQMASDVEAVCAEADELILKATRLYRQMTQHNNDARSGRG
jgi:hypothetical protein